ncbi:MAG: putative Regulator of nonsense transcripts 1 [Streblomastix strix]|uniref:Putative Regulator of nonsense transcripts 1 n=1 Tax=Streblomastix strix TaxID=222440 RepID=A0A5J4TMK0_9EUKA|nr:MAG: putative Regulator of nonsense transcripts 1 [Streblomastix strix]
MISLVNGAKHAVLVGDQNQLGPVIRSKKAALSGMTQSLFERMMHLGINPVMLQTQYRMHPELASFPSFQFYDGQLRNGVTAEDRKYRLETNIRNERQNEQNVLVFPWPNPNCPMMFINTSHNERQGGTSFSNGTEAQNVLNILKYLLAKGVDPNNIGVVTPYKLQIAYILEAMKKFSSNEKIQGKYLLTFEQYRKVQVASVDSFQGKEKDFIIFSCVRSNKKNEIGFLKDIRRLNVAITRARCGLIILGNAYVLSYNQLWNNFLVHLKERNCLVQGTFNNYKPFYIALYEVIKINSIQHYKAPDMPVAPKKEQQKQNEPSSQNKTLQKDKQKQQSDLIEVIKTLYDKQFLMLQTNSVNLQVLTERKQELKVLVDDLNKTLRQLKEYEQDKK